MPLHPRKRLKSLSKIDDKVHFVQEVASVKPKQLTKTKKKIEKMKLFRSDCGLKQTFLRTKLVFGPNFLLDKTKLNKKLNYFLLSKKDN